MSMSKSVQQQLNHIFFVFLFLALSVIKKGTATLTTLTTLKLLMLTTFDHLVFCVLSGSRTTRGKPLIIVGGDIGCRDFERKKKQVPCCRRKKKQVPLCRGKKVQNPCPTPPTMINGSSLKYIIIR